MTKVVCSVFVLLTLCAGPYLSAQEGASGTHSTSTTANGSRTTDSRHDSGTSQIAESYEPKMELVDPSAEMARTSPTATVRPSPEIVTPSPSPSPTRSPQRVEKTRTLYKDLRLVAATSTSILLDSVVTSSKSLEIGVNESRRVISQDGTTYTVALVSVDDAGSTITANLRQSLAGRTIPFTLSMAVPIRRDRIDLVATQAPAARLAATIAKDTGVVVNLDAELSYMRADLALRSCNVQQAVEGLAAALGAYVVAEGDRFSIVTGAHYNAMRVGHDVVRPGMAPRDFVQIAASMLGPGESLKPLDDENVAVVATSRTVERVRSLALELRSSIQQGARGYSVQVCALASGDLATSGGIRKSPAQVADYLGRLGATPSDCDDLPLPDSMTVVADVVAPASPGQENRVEIGDRMNLTYTLDSVTSGACELAIALNQSDPSGVFSGAPYRALLSNRFDATIGKPTIVGLSNPAHTVLLAVVIRPKQ